MSASAPAGWLNKVEEDEMRVLLRASSNYARLGHDPALARAQATAAARASGSAPRGAARAAAGAGAGAGVSGSSPRAGRARSSGRARFENHFWSEVPTVYRSNATGRSLTTALPAARPSSTGRAPVKPVSEGLRAATARAARARGAAAADNSDAALFAAAGLGSAAAEAPVHPSRAPLARLAQLTLAPAAGQRVVLPPGFDGPPGELAGAAPDSPRGGGADAGGDDADGVPRASDVLKRYSLFSVRANEGAEGALAGSLAGAGTRSGAGAGAGASAGGEERPAEPMPPGALVAEAGAMLRASGTTLDLFPPPGARRADGAGMPLGAASHAMLQNRVGRVNLTQQPLPRGGSGLVVGDLFVAHAALVPATLVVSKWGRVAATAYPAVPGEPCRMAVELQPLYYESMLADLDTVLGRAAGAYEFVPLSHPGAFLVDVGRVNARVHGMPRPPPLETRAGRAVEAAMVPGGLRDGQGAVVGAAAPAADGDALGGGAPPSASPGAGATTRFSIGDVGTAVGKAGKAAAAVGEERLRASRRRSPPRPKVRPPPTAADMEKAALSQAIDDAREQAARLLLKLARGGSDNALEKLLTDGLRVTFDPTPWYQRAADTAHSAKKRAAAAGEGGAAAAAGAAPTSSSSTSQQPAQPGQPPLALEDKPAAAAAGGRGAGDAAAAAAAPPGPPPPAPAPAPARPPVFVRPPVDGADVEGNTALLLAARGGWLDAALVLLRAGADHRRRNHAGQTALDLARAESAAASLALHVGAPGAAARKARAAKLAALLDDRTVLVCAQKGDLRRLEYLVEECEHPVTTTNAYGMTPLHFAVMRRDAAMAAFLARRGGDMNARNNLGQSPLSLVLEMNAGAAQTELLAALNAGPVTAAVEAAERANAAAAAAATAAAEAAMVSKLKTYARGTAAAGPVYAALGAAGKLGLRADFGPPPGAGRGAADAGDARDDAGAPRRRALAFTVSSDGFGGGGARAAAAAGGRRGRSASPPRGASRGGGGGGGGGALAGATAPAGAPLTRLDKARADGGHPPPALADSWARHMAAYISVAERNMRAVDAHATRVAHEAGDVARAALRAGRMSPGAVGGFVATHAGRVAASGAAALVGDAGARVRDSADLLRVDAAGGLSNVSVPPADSARFDAWVRMRFG